MSGEGAFVRGVAPGVAKGPEPTSEELIWRSEEGKAKRGCASTVRIVQEVDGLLESASACSQTIDYVSSATQRWRRRFEYLPSISILAIGLSLHMKSRQGAFGGCSISKEVSKISLKDS